MPPQISTQTESLRPEHVIGKLDVHRGMFVADFGAGSGFYVIPVARVVGESGKVYAIDIQKHHLDIIKSRAAIEHIFNIESVWGDLEIPRGSRLEDDSVDMVLIANILFQVDKKQEVLNEARRVLKKGGVVVLIEWDEGASVGGPPQNLRVSRRIVESLALAAGLIQDREFETGSFHYGLIYKK